jgi:hypothetical protein
LPEEIIEYIKIEPVWRNKGIPSAIGIYCNVLL